MASLLDDVGDVLGKVGSAGMSLLAPLAGGGQLAGGNDPAAIPAFLAFANRMAQAGAPTLGPPQPLLNVLPQAMAQGAGAAMQARQIPLLMDQVARETALRDVLLAEEQTKAEAARSDLEVTQMRNRARLKEMSADLAAAGGTEAGPPSASLSAEGASPPPDGRILTAGDLAALPDVQALPDQTRVPLIHVMARTGVTEPVAAQYARMLLTENGGLHIDPKTGEVARSDKGALGGAQIMPATFKEVAARYGIPGAVTDLDSNLTAGLRYFTEGGPNLRDATIRYVAGPGGLKRVQGGESIPAVEDYLVKTKTPAGPGVPEIAPGSPNDPMVWDQRGQNWYPRSWIAKAEAARKAALFADDNKADPMGYKARSEVLAQFDLQRTTQTGQGVQTKYGGQTSEAPTGQQNARVMTPEEAAKHGLNPMMEYQVTERPDRSIVKIEPIAPRQTTQQLDAEDKLRNEFLADPVVQDYKRALPYLRRMRATVAAAERGLTGVDDYALLMNYARLMQPAAVVKEGEEKALLSTGGIPARIKQAIQAVIGGTGSLTEDQRKWLMDSAETEMGGSELSVHTILMNKRRLAEGRGLRPDQIDIPDELSDWAKAAALGTPAGAGRPGKPTAPAYEGPTIPRPGIKTGAEALPGPRELVPPVTPPAPSGAPRGSAVEVPAWQLPSGQITPERLGALSRADLEKLGEYMLANPTTYTAAQKGMVAAAHRRAR